LTSLFFFSSRRRHTRSKRDWSSDVCSSDLCSTGVRVSKVKYITVEAANSGKAEISLKGKLRTILLPGRLCRKLKKYAKAQKTASGEIFEPEAERACPEGRFGAR